MIDFMNKVIRRAGDEYSIIRFEVWWHVETLGLCTTLDEALEVAGDQLAIRPISVAVAETTYEVL
jgi:hypothetical protein